MLIGFIQMQGTALKSEFPEELSKSSEDSSSSPTDKSEFDQENQIVLDKVAWYRSLRSRMALLMTMTTLAPIFVFHFIAIQIHRAGLGEIIWYVVLIPLLALINWFLAGYIIRPLKGLLQSTTKLANLDLRQRLRTYPG